MRQNSTPRVATGNLISMLTNQDGGERMRHRQIIEYDFERSIGYLVCCTSQALQNALNVELREQGITFRQWQVLACIALLGEPTQTQIADRLGIETATLVGVLDRMERDGWIGRYPCPADRRKKIIRATEQVRPVWEKMARCGRRVRQRASRGISASDLAIVWRVLERVQENLAARLRKATGPEKGSRAATASESA